MADRFPRKRLHPFLLCLLAGLLLPAPAQAAWPGKDGAIVFTRKGSSSSEAHSDLWIKTRSGKQRRLTATSRVSETEPTFSPDGRTIAYVRHAGGDADVWLMNSDGTRKRLLAGRSRVSEEGPAFFPNGRRLVIAAYSRDGWNLFSVNTDRSGRRREAPNGYFPSVSPNGRWLAYSQAEGNGGIRLLDLRTRKTRKLSPEGAHRGASGLDFSPDGQRILFSENRYCRPNGSLHAAILTVELRGGRERFLRRSCDEGYSNAVWAPSGERIVFARYKVVRRGAHSRLLVMSDEGAPLPGAPAYRPPARDFFPTWQPLR